MDQILLILGTLTLGGSAAVFLLAWAGRSTRARYGAKWRCWGWLLLCLRLAVPLPLAFQGEARAPIQVDVPNPPAVVQQPTAPNSPGSESTPVLPDAPQHGQAQPGPSGEDSAAPPPISPAPGKWRSADLSLILIAVWLTGAAVMLVWNGAAHLRFLRWLHRWSSPVDNWDAVDAFNHLGDQLGLHRRPRLLMCQGLKVPILAGTLRPAILLPQGKITGE